MASKRLALFARAALIGSLSFWLPILIARVLFGADWGVLRTVLLFTFLLPVLCCLVLEAFTEKWRQSRPGFAMAMLLGIWISGPFWMMLANTQAPGEGFHAAGAWPSLGLMTAAFPAATFMMSTYEGSLSALLLTTFALLVFSLSPWSFQPLTNRCVVCRSVLPR
jgi:hypothetical protein